MFMLGPEDTIMGEKFKIVKIGRIINFKKSHLLDTAVYSHRGGARA
eukprot:SAG31_NODE_3586_length_4094_cov_15.710388_6_plen_46_part_00